MQHFLSEQEAYRRAGGRRSYNRWRQMNALLRRRRLADRLLELGAGFFRSGAQVRLANELGVSRATISRDVQALLRATNEGKPCPCCGSIVRRFGNVDVVGLVRALR